MHQFYAFRHRVAALAVAFACTAGPLAAEGGDVDRALARLFSAAEAGNATLATCRAAIAEADAAVSAARADRLPDVTAEAAFSYNGDARLWDRSFKNGTAAPMPHFGNNYALMASQVVYAGGAIDAGIRLSEQSARLARLSAREQGERVRFLLTGLYLQLHSLANREQVYATNAALAADLIAQMKRRREEGTALRNDVTRYELQREQMLLGGTQTADQARIVRHQLLTALGTDTVLTLLPAEAFDRFDADTATALPARLAAAFDGHVAIEKGRLAVEMGQTQEKLERAARLPKVAIVAEDHLDGPLTFEVPPLNKNLNYWFVGVGITYDFSSLYKNNRKLKRARLATETARATLESTRREVDDAVQQAYVNCLTARAELRTQLKSVELAVQNYDVISRRYANGLALVTDLTDAAGVKLDAELALANARINLVYAHYALRYAAGQL